MIKKMLLISAAILIFDSPTYALDAYVGSHHFQSTPASKLRPEFSVGTEANQLSAQKVSAELLVDFAKFTYSANKQEWEAYDHQLFSRLVNDGWKFELFNGTTGSANNQVESISGLLAFKDKHVVIATRGTEATNLDDWTTNVRFARSPFYRLFSMEEAQKEGQIGAQFLNVDGGLANGFLQTHLSSWEMIKQSILNYAQQVGVTPQELQYTITGHSKGAAKAQLNAVNLLTDKDLAIGVNCLEKSLLVSEAEVPGISDLGASLFYAPALYSEPQNTGNVEAVVFESPRVFSDQAASQVERILGKDYLLRIENRGRFDVDPVVHVSPESFGFKHAGTKGEIDNGFFVGRHFMENVGGPAVGVIDAHRANVAAQASAASLATAEVFVPNANETVAPSFMQASVAKVVSSAKSLFSSIGATAKKAWAYWWK